jgi:hypothetical protein
LDPFGATATYFFAPSGAVDDMACERARCNALPDGVLRIIARGAKEDPPTTTLL